jgi:hypothetical protein
VKKGLTDFPNGCILYTYSRESPTEWGGALVKGSEKKSEKNRKNPLTTSPQCGTILTEQRKENLTNQKGLPL